MYVKGLFDRCWKMYEDTCKMEVMTWRAKHPDHWQMSKWLSVLSKEYWAYNPNGYDVEETRVMDYKYFEFPFGSLEELELKLTIRGY